MRLRLNNFLLCAAALTAARPGAAVDAATSQVQARLDARACPATLMLLQHDPSDIVAVFDAPRRSIASIRIRAYGAGGDAIADLPNVALSTPYAAGKATRYRSRAFDLRPPGGATVSAATIRATFDGASRTCPAEDRLLSPPGDAASTAAVDRGADFVAEAMTAAPVSFRPARTTRFACARPFARAAAIHSVTPEYPAAAGGAPGFVWIGVALNAADEATAFTTLRSNGSDVLDRAALRAARASTYASEIIGCRRHAGTYIFTASFQGTYR